jgi:alkanesulfonate monooxygenase SsuD/methylene tetrahydromethanopterin reductase-like flavin-dependent oxidoreductase (luciferase family)
MDVGMMMQFASYVWEHIGDEQVWREELQLTRLAVESGFDVLWAAEHHCFDYSFCPDHLQLMTYLAGLYPGMHLGTAAVIVPWHDPLRVAEQIAVLDLLYQGCVRFGMGRSPARREFEVFWGTMDESRERFDEASSIECQRAA